MWGDEAPSRPCKGTPALVTLSRLGQDRLSQSPASFTANARCWVLHARHLSQASGAPNSSPRGASTPAARANRRPGVRVGPGCAAREASWGPWGARARPRHSQGAEVLAKSTGVQGRPRPRAPLTRAWRCSALAGNGASGDPESALGMPLTSARDARAVFTQENTHTVSAGPCPESVTAGDAARLRAHTRR